MSEFLVYKIQLDAPTPKPLIRLKDVPYTTDFYGLEFHGILDHKVAETLLNNTADGSYLVRQSPDAVGYYTLSLRFGNRTKHFKIYFKPGFGHFLKEDFKRFDSVEDLVADGLVNFFMQAHAAPIIQEMMSQTFTCYQQSPYMTLNRRKLKALSNDLRKSMKSSDAGENTSTNVVAINANDAVEPKTPPISAQEEIEIVPIIYEKAHSFKVHTFKGLNWCELCANFLWGFTAQGVKCEG